MMTAETPLDNDEFRARMLRILAGDDLPHVEFYSEANRTLLQSIDCGLVYLMAFWSGPAILAWVKFAEFATRMRDSQVRFAAVDVDGSPDLYDFLQASPGNPFIAGWGEIIWLRRGLVVSMANGRDVLSLRQAIERNTESILQND